MKYDDIFTNFGFKKVKISEKVELVKNVFDNVASSYDLMNDLMSLGTHRLWKKDLVNMIDPQSTDVILDVGGGTGDISIALAEKAQKVYCLDINENMLAIGKEKALNNGYVSSIEFICADAQNTPIATSSIDKYTTSFCIRNVADINLALADSYRVLKKGGKFYCLEFSKVNNEILNKLYKIWSFKVIPNIGKYVAKDKDSYQYLVESIEKFPTQEQFKTMIENAGYKNVGYKNIFDGIASIHYGEK
jgi:demethylmenaquinone methyltransferase/2-methoxy-6-polyprenyl-1,4-benzoquinol methylase